VCFHAHGCVQVRRAHDAARGREAPLRRDLHVTSSAHPSSTPRTAYSAT
jgi:hypothetical protein